MTGTRGDDRVVPDAAESLGLALARRPRPNPLVVLWRWRYEAAVVALGAAMVLALGPRSAGVVAVAALAVGAGVAAWPAARRLALARLWCVITPHRIRAACAEGWLHSRSGRIPAVLWTSARPYGEAVTLWCRAGTTAAQFDSHRAVLAAACWASDVRVERLPRRPYLVRLHVVRRPAPRGWPTYDDPLLGTEDPTIVLPDFGFVRSDPP